MGVNLEALEVLLIDLSLWKDSECFRLVLEHLTDLLDETYSTSHLKGINNLYFEFKYTLAPERLKITENRLFIFKDRRHEFFLYFFSKFYF